MAYLTAGKHRSGKSGCRRARRSKREGLLMVKRIAVATVFLLCFFPRSYGGPCTDCNGDGTYDIKWRYDTLLWASDLEVGRPDIAVPGFMPTTACVVFSAREPGGNFDVYFSKSEDGGCTWTTRAVTGNAADEIDPAIAVDDTGRCMVIVFNRVVTPASGEGNIIALTSGDGGSTFPLEEKLSSSGISGDMSSFPDVAVTPWQSAHHFHAVWQATSSSHQHVFYRRNLMTNACPPPARGWVGRGITPSPTESDMTTESTTICSLIDADSFRPHVSADTRSRQPFVESACSIVFETECAGGRHVFFTRSNDSGDTFFGQEAAPQVIAPLRINAASSVPLGEADIDASDNGSGAENWNAVIWPDDRVPAPNAYAFMDAQSEDGATILSDWDDLDVGLRNTGQFTAGTVAISAFPTAIGVGGAGFFAFWSDTDRATDLSDIYYRVGRFAAGAHPNIEFSCDALPGRLTGVSPLDRLTVGGEGGLPASDERSSGLTGLDVFLVWRDTRNSPGGQIFFKRTDSVAPDGVKNLQATARVCPDNDIDVSWTPPSACDVGVYHVTATGPDTVNVDVSPPATSVVIPIDDAIQGAPFDITVTVEDQACNMSPPEDVVVPVTPRCPVLEEGTEALGITCNGAPDSDAEPDPGEEVTLSLPVTNATGTADATGAVGTIRIASPLAGVTVIDGTSTYPDLVAGDPGFFANDTLFKVRLSPTVDCPTTVEVDLDLTTDQVPFSLRFFFPVGQNGCEDACIPECDPDSILAIRLLKCAKIIGSPGDLRLSWLDDPQALDGYNVWYVTDPLQIPACETCPGSIAVAGCQPTGDPLNVTCDHNGGVSGVPGEIFFYNVRGVCQGVEAPD
jgi:hypothetical protein